MISERSRGLYAVHCVVQAFLVTILFWAWLLLYAVLYAPGSVDYRRYAIYSLLTVTGLVLKALTTASARRALLRLRVIDRLRDCMLMLVVSAQA